MRGARAKEIRKLVYGDMSPKIQRTYSRTAGGVILSTGLRWQYQRSKKVIKKWLTG